MTRPDAGVELLERALGYTRGVLRQVRPTDLHRPTPCADWTLDRLLDHMHDALAAFTEGADGAIPLAPRPRLLDVRVATLQSQACGLLAAWSSPAAPEHVVVGGLPVPTAVVVRAAAVEITTHGWDVAQAIHPSPVPVLPPGLARELHRAAVRLVDDADRAGRFAAPLDPGPWAGAGDRFLGFLGRRTDRAHLTGPPAGDSLNRRTRERPAS